MDVRNLNYILEVARQQNITKAAEHLHLSQPTLSKIIKNVEEELGVTLFDRSRKQLKLTDSGLAAVRQFQIIVEAAVELRRELEELEHLESGILTIGLPPVISSVFVPRMVAGFQKQYPRVDIRMVEEGAKTIERLVQNGQLELGFVVSPVDEQAFDRLPLLERRLSLVVHRSHRLAEEPSVSIRELSSDAFIRFPKGFAVQELVAAACGRAGFEPSIVYESAHWDLQVDMVAERLGVAILPDAACQKIANPHVRVLALEDPILPWHLVLIWQKDGYVSHAMKGFIRFAQAAIAVP